jgi:hypothetical protein
MKNLDWGDTKEQPDLSGKISFGIEDSDAAREMLHESDELNIDPSWFNDIRQYDAYSCAYFVMTALQRMQAVKQDESRSMQVDEMQGNVVNRKGLGLLKKYIQEDRTDQLSAQEFRERLRTMSTPEAQSFGSRSEFAFDKEGLSIGELTAKIISSDYSVGLDLRNLGHLVLAFGISRDRKELICWDPLLGTPDIKYPGCLLRRVKVDDPNIYLWGGLKTADSFREPRRHRVLSGRESHQSQVEFGDLELDQSSAYTDQRRGLWQRLLDFIDNF